MLVYVYLNIYLCSSTGFKGETGDPGIVDKICDDKFVILIFLGPVGSPGQKGQKGELGN